MLIEVLKNTNYLFVDTKFIFIDTSMLGSPFLLKFDSSRKTKAVRYAFNTKKNNHLVGFKPGCFYKGTS